MFSSGVDRKCNQYKFVDQPAPRKNGKNGSINGKPEMVTKWVLAGSRRFHSHDVRAMALDDTRNVNALVSGGVDVSMVVCPAADFPDTNQRRLPHVPQRPIVSISKSKRLMLCRQEHGVKVWRLGKCKCSKIHTFFFTSKEFTSQTPFLTPEFCFSFQTAAAPVQPYSELDIGAHMDLIEPQQAILEMNFKDDYNLTASALSEDGHWIAVADIEEVKLFRIDENVSA